MYKDDIPKTLNVGQIISYEYLNGYIQNNNSLSVELNCRSTGINVIYSSQYKIEKIYNNVKVFDGSHYNSLIVVNRI